MASKRLVATLAQSENTWVRVQSAEELMFAGRASGFRFAADAIEHSARSSRDLITFVKDHFPGQKDADDAAILKFLTEQARK
jgi:hypothetical protein